MKTTDSASSYAMEGVNLNDRENQPFVTEYEAEFLDDAMPDEAQGDVNVYNDTCRICANVRDHMIPIFEDEGAEHKLSVKIHKYLPIKVSVTDSLPHKLCYHCAATLLAWHDLIIGCVDAEKKLLQMQTELERREANRTKPSDSISRFDGLSEAISIANAESADVCHSIDGEKSAKNVPEPTQFVEEETIYLKYEDPNLNATNQENSAANEFFDDPEAITVEKLEIPYTTEDNDGSERIRAGQRIEQTTENVKHFDLGQETTERSRRTKKPFKLFIDTGKIFRLERKIKIKIADVAKKSIAKNDEASSMKNPSNPSMENIPNSFQDSLANPSSHRLGPVPENSPKPQESPKKLQKIKKTNEKKFSNDQRTSNPENTQNSEDFESPTIEEQPNPTKNNAPTTVKCSMCKKKFSNIEELQQHAKIHENSTKIQLNVYQCVLCDKNFRLKGSMIRHLRIHRDEKPFTCHVCGKQFRDNGGWSRHLRDVHAKQKNFYCDICGNNFSSKATRDDHRRIHTGERPYACEICRKTFKSKACLYIHGKIHTDEFPHKCLCCDKKFRRRQEMLVHATTHTGEKNYSCDVCSKRFRVKTEVTRHKLTHSDEKPFVCAKCGLRFRQNRYLNNHVKSRHVQTWKD